MSSPLIETRQLVVEVGGRCVVNHLDLAVGVGERVAILGRNGPANRLCYPPWPGCASPPVAPFCWMARIAC